MRRRRSKLIGVVLAAGLAVGVDRIPASAAPRSQLAANRVAPGAGAKLWAARYDGPAHSDDGADALAPGPDGSKVYVTGSSYDFSTMADYATVAYDAATGAQLWAARYNGPGNGADDPTALAVSPDGATVLVTGSSYGASDAPTDYATVAYDANSGTQLWVARYDGTGHSYDDATDIALSPDGAAVFVTGTSDGGADADPDYATVAYDTGSGTQLWVARYEGRGGSDDIGNALRVSPDGATVFVTGASYVSIAVQKDYVTLAYDTATGSTRWQARYSGPGHLDDTAYGLGVSADGRTVFVTGSSYGVGSRSDYATVAYAAATGAKRWVARYNGPQDSWDDAYALAVSPDGARIFVTGGSYGTENNYDYGTLGYDAVTGTQLWVARYDGAAKDYDQAAAVGVSPDGATVFVTGSSYPDYATLAYDAGSGTQLRVVTAARGDATTLGVSPLGTAEFVSGFFGSPTDFGTFAYDLVP